MENAEAVAYVLRVGLPPLPRRLGGGRLVPVAVWTGGRFAAVTVVEDDEYEGGLVAMTYTYRRVEGGWEASRGAGGDHWPGGTGNTATAGLEDREVLLEGGRSGFSHSWSCCVVAGFAGAAARWVELDEPSGTVRRDIPPSGAVLAVRQGDARATVRVLDQHGDLLADWQLVDEGER